MSDAQLKRLGDGRYQVAGALVFATVGALLAVGENDFKRDAPREIDLSGVTAGDSAGLALLIEWMSLAHKRGGAVRFIGTPPQLASLAKISDLDKVLSLNAG